MDWTLFLTYLAATGAAAATGAMFQPGVWYQGLAKPRWTPPGWVFPLVWTTLYFCMALAAMRVAGLAGSGQSGVGQALALWALQIALNTLWTPVFFGLHRIRTALGVMAGLWVAVTATTVSFLMLDAVAGLLFAPYLVWVSIAGALNFTVWRMNPKV